LYEKEHWKIHQLEEVKKEYVILNEWGIKGYNISKNKDLVVGYQEEVQLAKHFREAMTP
jgi:hypothetical protein